MFCFCFAPYQFVSWVGLAWCICVAFVAFLPCLGHVIPQKTHPQYIFLSNEAGLGKRVFPSSPLRDARESSGFCSKTSLRGVIPVKQRGKQLFRGSGLIENPKITSLVARVAIVQVRGRNDAIEVPPSCRVKSPWSLDVCYGRAITFCRIYVPGNNGHPLLKTCPIRWGHATFFSEFLHVFSSKSLISQIRTCEK